MAIDSTITVRRAILTLLKNDARTTGIVPKDRWFPMTASSPDWPFGMYGASTPLPIRATCVDGSEITTSVHGFAKARPSSGPRDPGETAEDHCGRLAAAIASVLGSRRIDLPNGYGKITWTGSQLLVDGAEADAFHCVVNLRVRCITA